MTDSATPDAAQAIADDPLLAGVIATDVSDDPFIFKWGGAYAVWTPVTVTYSFMQSLPDYQDPAEFTAFAPLNTAMEAAARGTLAAWAAAADITFTEVADSVGGAIRFGTDASYEFAGYAYYPQLTDYPGGDTYTDLSGDVVISSSFSYTTAPEAGNYGYLTFLHEIGHAIGLKHPFEAPSLPVAFDDSNNTVMSYNTLEDAGGNYASTLGWLDIHAVQHLYGIRGSGSQGTTAWGDDGADSYAAASDITRYLANGGDDLVTMGGGDDIVLGGSGADTLSGAAGTDQLYGGSDDDVLAGGVGADLLAGGDGRDLAVFGVAAPDDPGRVMRDDGTVSLQGNDTVVGVEVLSFADGATVLTFDTVTDTANFDESRYLVLNPDVAAAVAAGTLESGYVHYLAFGQAEARDVGASYSFDEAGYRDGNPDVAAAVAAGDFASGAEHFALFGRAEGRDPNPFFDTGYYLAQNPDVAAAVSAGDFASGYDHFEAFGAEEGRAAAAVFDTAAYLVANPDVAAAGVNALDHYLGYGVYEGRTAYAVDGYFF